MATLIQRYRRLIIALGCGASLALAVSGCSNDDARNTVLSGLNEAANTLSAGLLDAYFITLQEEEATTSLGIL